MTHEWPICRQAIIDLQTFYDPWMTHERNKFMFNFLEKFVFRRIVKKLIKAFPSLKEKGLKIYEENKEEIIQNNSFNLLDNFFFVFFIDFKPFLF